MTKNKKTDVIVVGAGPAGISCAITIARAGKKVVLIERGSFAGSKNVLAARFIHSRQKKFFRILKRQHRLKGVMLNINLLF